MTYVVADPQFSRDAAVVLDAVADNPTVYHRLGDMLRAAASYEELPAEAKRVWNEVLGHDQKDTEFERLHPRARGGRFEKKFASVAEYMRELDIGAMLVGGAVRDELLGRPHGDEDFIVPGLTIHELYDVLRKHGGGVEDLVVGNRQVGFRFYPRYEGAPPGGVEVVPPRKEVSTGPRREDFDIVADPSVSLEEDAARRDFTVNALYKPVGEPKRKETALRQGITAYLGRLRPEESGRVGEIADVMRGGPIPPGVSGREDPTWSAVFAELHAMKDEGLLRWGHVGGWRLRDQPKGAPEIIDPLGTGVDDIRDEVLRTTSPESFRDDPLRIIRGLRFMSQLGFKLHPATETQMREHAAAIDNVSRERIGGGIEASLGELSKLLLGKDPASALRTARDTGVLERVIPPFRDAIGFDQESKYHGLTLDEHIIQAVQHAADAGAPLEVRLALLLHDLGKPESAWRGDDGHLHFYRSEEHGKRAHEEIGADIASEQTKALKYPVTTQNRVRLLVAEHMFQVPDKPTAAAARRFLARHGDLTFDLIAHKRADLQAKDAEDEVSEATFGDWVAGPDPKHPGIETLDEVAGHRIRYAPSLRNEATHLPGGDIHVGPKFFELSPEARRTVLVHEVGHGFDDDLLKEQPDLINPEKWKDKDGEFLNGPLSNANERIADAYAALNEPTWRQDLDRWPVIGRVGEYAAGRGYPLHPEARRALATDTVERLDRWEALIKEQTHQPVTVRDLAVNGNDLIDLGYAPGPPLGQALQHLLRNVVGDPGLNNREWLLGEARRLLPQLTDTPPRGQAKGVTVPNLEFEAQHPRGQGGRFENKLDLVDPTEIVAKMPGPRSRNHTVIRSGLDAIGKVIALPATAPKVEIAHGGVRREESEGYYDRAERRINVYDSRLDHETVKRFAEKPDAVETVVHEFAHHLEMWPMLEATGFDRQHLSPSAYAVAFNPSALLASRLSPDVLEPSPYTEQMSGLWDAFNQTEAIHALRMLSDGPDKIRGITVDKQYAKYMLNAQEVFARAFSQWVALRSGDERLRSEIDTQLSRQRETQVSYPWLWEWDDFRPVAEQMDKVFASLGWLR